MCTPLTYDSMGQGRNFGRQIVHRPGVAKATPAAAATAAARLLPRATAGGPLPANQHTAPINIIEMPRIFRTSTRKRSVHGDRG